MVDSNYLTDLNAFTDDLQADQLVVIPGVWFFRKNFSVGVNEEDRFDESFGRVTVFYVLKKKNWGLVVIAEFLDRNGLSEPR